MGCTKFCWNSLFKSYEMTAVVPTYTEETVMIQHNLYNKM